MHGLRRRLSEPRMAGHFSPDQHSNQRVTSPGDSFYGFRALCYLQAGPCGNVMRRFVGLGA
jgi:hypothetical protein